MPQINFKGTSAAAYTKMLASTESGKHSAGSGYRSLPLSPYPEIQGSTHDRLLRSDVKHGFSIGMASLKTE
jgi:hypothetical protein